MYVKKTEKLPGKRLFFIALLALAGHQISAQTTSIHGTVADEAKQPLIGASIVLKGTGQGASTDAEGHFVIQGAMGDTLIVSSLNYRTIALPINKATMLIQLLPDETALQEVVVTALGIKKEVRKLGYAVQEVKGSDVNKVRDVNPLNAMAGKVAGLTVGASTEMLGRPEIVLRGSKDLLFVVDGVPINSDTWNISPDDIDSYSILKGPNAAALYGSRGINGAIVITTKKGTGTGGAPGKNWSIDFNSTTQAETGFIALPESQYEYGRGTGFKYTYGNVLYDNTQRLPEWGPRFEGQPIQQYDSPWDAEKGLRGTTPWLARGKDNFDNFSQTGLTSTNNLAFSKSGEDYDMRLSYTHSYQKGVFPNTKLNGDNFNIGAGYDISDKLRIDGNINMSLQYSPNIPDVNYGPNSYTYMFKVYGSSDYDIRDLEDIYKGPQGVQDLMQYSAEYGRLNSAWFMAKEWLRSHDKTDVFGHLRLSYKFNDHLSAFVRSQVTTWNQLRTEKVPPSTNLNDYVQWYYFGWYGDYREDQRKVLENNTDFALNFDQNFGDWSVSALAGASSRAFSYQSNWATTKALVIPKLYSFSNSQNPVLAYNYNAKMQVYSAYYSADIGYKNYFNVNTTGRMDNLSTLPSGSNTFFYPSVSVSSVLNEYIKLPSIFNMVKVRASLADVKGGLTSPTIGSAFSAITGKSLNAGLLHYGNELYSTYDGPSYGNQNVYTLFSYYNGLPSVDYSSTIASPALKPYNRVSYEAGLDINMFKNRLGINATYFRTTNGPQIFALNVAPSTGYTARNINGITTLNQGFEISVNGSPIKHTDGFNWNIAANWSTYRETLKDIYEGEDVLTLNGHDYRVGDRLDAVYGRNLVRDGQGNVVHNAGLIYQAPTGNSQNGFLGNLNPDFSFGINNQFSYKNWALSFQVDGRIGGKIYDFTYAQTLNGGTGIESASGAFGDARYQEWVSLRDNGTVTPAYIGDGVKIVSGTPVFQGGQITNLDELTFAPNDVPVTTQSYITVSTGLYGNQEYFMVDRSFAKLREASISYSLPAKVLERSFIKGATFSLVGRNLLYFAARKDMDMDAHAAGFNASDRSASGMPGTTGLESATTRRFGFNINLSF